MKLQYDFLLLVNDILTSQAKNGGSIAKPPSLAEFKHLARLMNFVKVQGVTRNQFFSQHGYFGKMFGKFLKNGRCLTKC